RLPASVYEAPATTGCHALSLIKAPSTTIVAGVRGESSLSVDAMALVIPREGTKGIWARDTATAAACSNGIELSGHTALLIGKAWPGGNGIAIDIWRLQMWVPPKTRRNPEAGVRQKMKKR